MAPILVRSLSLVAALCRDVGERRQQRHEEPGEPDALAFAAGADEAHPVVPVAGAHQRQSVRTGREADVQRAHAVVVQRA